MVSHDTDQRMDISDPVSVPGANVSLSDLTLNLPETDYGPWLLVSHRRGSARGCGDGARAAHVTPSTAAELISNAPDVFAAPHHSPPVNNPTIEQSLEIIPTHLGNINAESVKSSLINPNSQALLLPSTQTISQEIPRDDASLELAVNPTISRTARDVGNYAAPTRSTSSPPILRTSTQDTHFEPSSPSHAHGTLVAQISSALDSSEMEEDSGDDEDFSDEEDVEMFDDGDGPDDFMTLIQYQ